ncbi:MAG TPA: hypothetical protein VMV07_20530 [Streptosporangiaceae bacterium]|nr:hypothetical protein [Streptosporangiaceae bacterium]
MAVSTCVCPYCYHTIAISRPAYRCGGQGNGIKEPCKKGPDEQRERATGVKVPVLPSFLPPPDISPVKGQVICPKCAGKTGTRVCPVCHTPLPSGLGDTASPLIGMVGAKGTGKTVFMTVLLHQLQNGVARRYGASVDIVGDTPDGLRSAATAWMADFERPLFTDRSMIQQTAQAKDAGRQPPFVVQWRQPRRVLFFDRTKTMALSFYDQSGEDLTRQDSVNAHHYLAAAGGLMVLLDPLQLPGVRDVVTVPENATVTDAEPPISVLTRVTEMLRSSHGVPVRKKVQVPLAVIFAKVDALFPVLGEHHPIRQVSGNGNGNGRGRDGAADGAEVHEYVRSLLHKWGADNVDAHLRLNYSTFRYFAVSALGAPPVGGKLAPGDIRPLRVDEPLIWLMKTLRLLGAAVA